MLYALNRDFLLFTFQNSAKFSIGAFVLDWLLLYTKETFNSYSFSLLEKPNARTFTVFVF